MAWRDMSRRRPYRGAVGKPAGGRLLPGSGRTWLRELGLALVTAGFVVLLFAAYELVGTNLTEERSQAALARQFETALARSATPQVASQTTAAVAATNGNTARRTGVEDVSGEGTGGSANGADGSTVGNMAGASRGQTKQVRPASPTSTALAGFSLPIPSPGGALDHLVIPAIGLSRYVVQGVDETDLQMGPGHYPGTPLPGQQGNVGIAGHRTTFGAPFFSLNEVAHGDLILLTDTSGTTWVYDVVRQWVVDPSDTAVLDPTHTAMLTLTTCNPRFEATSRLVVRAALLKRVSTGSKVPGEAAPPATGQRRPLSGGGVTGSLSQVPPASTTTRAGPTTYGNGTAEGSPTVESATVQPASSTTNIERSSNSGGGWTWLATIGFALLALMAWVGARVFAAHLRRYGKYLALVAGVVVCLVPLWFAFENLVDLLPANI